MESQTQTATVPPVLGNTRPGHETTPNNDVGNGFRLAEGNFPKPKLAPKKDVEEPEDEQSLDDRMATDEEREDNRKKWEAYNASEWGRYKALKEEVESVNPDGFVKAGEAEEDGNGSRQILANMSFRNGHEVNQYLLEQLRVVLETDADRTKRVEGYNYLESVVSKHKGLKAEWDSNVKRMKRWADSGYPGDFQPTYLHRDGDKKGEEIKDKNDQAVHTPPGYEDKYWSKMDHRKEAPPKQNKALRLPKSATMDDVRAEAGLLLQKIAQSPELIRDECGKRLGILNDTIGKLSSEYVTRYNADVKMDEEKIQSLTDQRVPDIRITQMIVEFVEQLVATGQDSLGEANDVKTEYDLLRKALERAGHPGEWFDLIETTVGQKVKLARDFIEEHPDKDYHEHPDLWRSDLDAWLINKVATSGQHSSSQVTADRARSDSSAPNQQPGTSVAGEEGSSTGQPPSSGGANVASGETSNFGKSSTGVFPDAVKIDCDPTHVLDGGQTRKIEGYLEVGRGHSLLIRMNEPEAVPALCELTAAGPFGRSKLKEYQALSKARHIQRQTDLEFLKTKSITDLHCTFIATQRNTYSRTIIGGRFGDDDPSIERHYFQSQLDRAMGKASVDGWIKEVWPELYEDEGDDVESGEYSADEPPAPSTQKAAPVEKGHPSKKKSAAAASKPAKSQKVDDSQKSQLEFMKTQVEMLMEQMKVLQSSLGGGVQT